MKKIALTAVVFSLCLLVWFPMAMMIGNTLMSEGEMVRRYGAVLGEGGKSLEFTFLPDYPTLRPYLELLLDSPGFFVMFWNSFLQVGAVLAGQLAVAVPSAWAFARFQFPRKRPLFLFYLLLMVLPFQVTMAPNYFLLSRLKLLDTHLAVILPGIFSGFPVFMMTKFFETIPESLPEAARLEGAGEWTVFLKIGLPLGAPGAICTLLLGFLEYWNAIEQPMIFLKNKALWPLSLYLPNITADKVSVAWTASAAAMALPLLLFLTGQSYLEKGIAISGIKE